MSRYHALMQSKDWAITRAQVFARDRYRCQVCGRVAVQRECDHIEPLWVNPDRDPLDKSNLQTICTGCHIAKTGQEARKRAERPKPQQPAWNALVGELSHA